MKTNAKNTILLIDPDVTLTERLASRLTNVGFNVLVANEEILALKLLHVSTPDIVLLDLLMKDQDGKDIDQRDQVQVHHGLVAFAPLDTLLEWSLIHRCFPLAAGFGGAMLGR